MSALVDDEGVLQIQGRHHLGLDAEVQVVKGKDPETMPDEQVSAEAEIANQDLLLAIDAMQT